MVSAVLNFVNLLRKAGIKISPAEIQDCLLAIEWTGFIKEDFKQALMTTLVKEEKDMRIFERLFNLYFLNETHSSFSREEVEAPAQRKTFGNAGKGMGRSGAGGPGQGVIETLSSGNESALYDLAENAVKSMGELELEDVDYIREKIREAEVSLEWFMVHHEIEKMLSDGRINYEKYLQWINKLGKLHVMIEEKMEEFLMSKYGHLVLEKLAEVYNTGETDFFRLENNEINQVKQKIKKLGKQLTIKKSKRYKISNRGMVDMKKTTKKAIVYGGIPLELVYKKKKRERPELIVLCDISNSVEQYSKFMLQLVYAAEEYFKDIHSFVFVDHISYVSPLFKQMSPEKALSEIKSLSQISDTGYSHYGQVFFEFSKEYFSMITEKSTIIILGDAKNNWRPNGNEYLKKIADSCRKLYWLNPQPLEQWDTEDSIISTYAPWCSGIFECRNMNQLEKAVNKIF